MSATEAIMTPAGWNVVIKAIIGVIFTIVIAGGARQFVAMNEQLITVTTEMRALTQQVENGTRDRYTGSMAATDKQIMTETINRIERRLDLFIDRTETRLDKLNSDVRVHEGRITRAEADHDRWRREVTEDTPR